MWQGAQGQDYANTPKPRPLGGLTGPFQRCISAALGLGIFWQVNRAREEFSLRGAKCPSGDSSGQPPMLEYHGVILQPSSLVVDDAMASVNIQ